MYCANDNGIYSLTQCDLAVSSDGLHCGPEQEICEQECASTQIKCDADSLKCVNATQSRETSPKSVAILVTFPITFLVISLLLTLAFCFADIRHSHRNRRKRLYASQEDKTE